MARGPGRSIHEGVEIHPGRVPSARSRNRPGCKARHGTLLSFASCLVFSRFTCRELGVSRADGTGVVIGKVDGRTAAPSFRRVQSFAAATFCMLVKKPPRQKPISLTFGPPYQSRQGEVKSYSLHRKRDHGSSEKAIKRFKRQVEKESYPRVEEVGSSLRSLRPS